MYIHVWHCMAYSATFTQSTTQIVGSNVPYHHTSAHTGHLLGPLVLAQLPGWHFLHQRSHHATVHTLETNPKRLILVVAVAAHREFQNTFFTAWTCRIE